MNVRPISADELDDLLELYTHLNPADAPLPERSLVLSIWQELMSNPRYKYFGGYVGDRLISTCTLSVIPNLTRGGRPYGIIENVVTHAEFRDHCYGKAVLAAALSSAWADGCYNVMLLTGRKEEAIFNFYESAGFNRHEKQAFIAKPPV